MASVICKNCPFYMKRHAIKSLPSSLVRTKEYQTLNKRDLAKTEVSCRWGHTVLPGFVQQV